MTVDSAIVDQECGPVTYTYTYNNTVITEMEHSVSSNNFELYAD